MKTTEQELDEYIAIRFPAPRSRVRDYETASRVEFAEAERKANETRPTACLRCNTPSTVAASLRARWRCEVEGCGGQTVRVKS